MTEKAGRYRVFVVNRWFFPDHAATSQILSDLVFSLDDVDVVAIASRGRYDGREKLPRYETIDGVSVERVAALSPALRRGPRLLLDALLFHLLASLKLARRARSGDVVLVKTDPPLLGVSIGLIALLRGARAVHWLQDIFPETAQQTGMRGLNGPLGRILLWLRDWSLRRSSQVVAIGHQMKDQVLRRGIDPEKVTVIPNWFQEEPPSPSQGRPVRAEPNRARPDPDQFRVRYSGNLGRAHPIDAVVGAMRNRPNGVQFDFIGGGLNYLELLDIATSEDLSNVAFHPYVARSDVLESLRQADVHLIILDPKFEGLMVPSKFYGVLAAGRACIVLGKTDGEIAALVQDHDIGRAVAIDDEVGLLAAIEQLRLDPELCEAMGERARVLYTNEYEMHYRLTEWRTLLDAIARRPS